MAHGLYSTYAFTSISAVFKVIAGDSNKTEIACISATITPDLGHTISGLLTYLPLLVLILVGIATAAAAVFSPWGSTDVFRWTSNYGRDDDLLRLMTPGFGDCLQYIQFIVLAGSLSLNYPGFYQPVVSKVSWSALMFNQSFVSHGNGSQSLVDGVYNTNGTYGLDRMSQLVGMTADKDIWPGTIVWLLVVIGSLLIVTEVWFICRWLYRNISNTPEEDLRAKNLPFTIGNSIRVVFNYFLLPIVALSMYQLVVAGRSAPSAVGLAALTLVALVGFSCWLLWLIGRTRPRSYLFDDLPTVLLYGPLYNTYSDNAATFALVPVFITFVRGAAIGAVQPSGIAQLVLLAICEVILVLTLNAFRPFHSPTSMNAFHTFFAVVRLLTILLSVAFVPSLGVGSAARGWIGYVMLLLHTIVLFVGFFLHSIQTLIEVLARLAGAGGEEGVGGGAARGGLVKVFGMRQLSRRNPRKPPGHRHSAASDAAMLGQDSDKKSIQYNGGRSRSLSGSSAILLSRQPYSDGRRSVGLDSVSVPGTGHNPRGSVSAPYTPTTPGDTSALSSVPGGGQNAGRGGGSPRSGIINLKAAEPSDPYYRPPRAKRTTVDSFSPGARSPGSLTSAEWANKRWSLNSPENGGSPDLVEGTSASGRATPLPAHLGAERDQSDPNVDDGRQSKTDYAIREVDFYYGVRGPALSNQPTRRLKTGPADPTGPVSSAAGWIKSLFGGKTKDKGKGFEVVRSSRVPSLGPSNNGLSLAGQQPYTDDPSPEAIEMTRDFDTREGEASHSREIGDDASPVSSESESEDEDDFVSDEENPSELRASQVSQHPPSLPHIDTVGQIDLPSRVGSKASSRPSRRSTGKGKDRVPAVPRKSSRRKSSPGFAGFDFGTGPRLSAIAASPPPSPAASKLYDPEQQSRQHLQPSQSISQRLPFESAPSSAQANRLSIGATSTNSSGGNLPLEDGDAQASGHTRQSSSALGTLAPDLRDDRPSSVGYVPQHRASDHIHRARSNDQVLLGSTAELVDDSSRRSTSPESRLPNK